MSKINVNNKDQLFTLRKMMNNENLFPFAGYSVNDSNVYFTVQMSVKHEGDMYPTTVGEFNENDERKLPKPLREAMFKELSKVNFDTETVEHMKKLGIEIVYGQWW